jgi:hypothetical protein
MVPPGCRLPVAPILQVSAIAVRCAIDINIHNRAIQFLCEPNFSFILLSIILQAAAQRAR